MGGFDIHSGRLHFRHYRGTRDVLDDRSTEIAGTRVSMRLDNFDGVAEIGQAFADELFRVFAAAHPEVRLTPINTSHAVAQMVRRAMSATAK